MKKWILWVVAGVLGIALAIVIMPRPDTGDAVSPNRMERGDVAVDGAGPGKDDNWRPEFGAQDRPGEKPAVDRVAIGLDPQPDKPPPVSREDLAEWRNSPQVRAMNSLSPKWGQVRRSLNQYKQEKPEAEALMEETTNVIRTMSQMRRNPGAPNYLELYETQSNLLNGVKALGIQDPDLDSALNALDGALQQYRDAAP